MAAPAAKVRRLRTLESIKADQSRAARPTLAETVLTPRGALLSHIMSYTGYGPFARLTRATAEQIREAKARECEIQPVWNAALSRYICEPHPLDEPFTTTMGYPCCYPWELTPHTIANVVRASGRVRLYPTVPLQLPMSVVTTGQSPTAVLPVPSPSYWYLTVADQDPSRFALSVTHGGKELLPPEAIATPLSERRLRHLWQWVQGTKVPIDVYVGHSGTQYDAQADVTHDGAYKYVLHPWEEDEKKDTIGWLQRALLVPCVEEAHILRVLPTLLENQHHIGHVMRFSQDRHGPALAEQAGRPLVAQWLANQQKEKDVGMWLRYALPRPAIVPDSEVVQVLARSWKLLRHILDAKLIRDLLSGRPRVLDWIRTRALQDEREGSGSEDEEEEEEEEEEDGYGSASDEE